MQLIVVGMHRSGTSVLARLLNMMGAYFAPEGLGTGASQENPKGFWERRDVRVLNDYVLHSLGCDWDRISGFDLKRLPAAVEAEFLKTSSGIVLGMDAYRPWMLKEPRLCLLLPLWRKSLEVPVCLHIIRHPVEVAASLQARNAIPIEVGLELWEAYNRAAIEGMEDVPRLTVFHDSLIEDPEEATRSVHGELVELGVPGLRMPLRREIEAFVSRDLHRQRRDRPELAEFAGVSQARLYEEWKSAGRVGKQGAACRGVGRFGALKAYESTLPPLNVISPKPTLSPSDKGVQAKLVTYEHEIRLKKTQLEQSRKSAEQAVGQLAFLQGEYEKLQSYMLEQSAASQQERGRLLDELKRERERTEAATADIVEKEKRIAALLEKIERLGKEARDRQSELVAAREEAARQLADASARIAESQASASAQVSAVEQKALTREKDLQEKLAALEAKLAERFGEIERLTRMLEQEEGLHRKVASERASLQSRLSEIEKRCVGLENEVVRRGDEVSRIQAQIAAVEKSRLAETDRAERLKDVIAAAVTYMEHDKIRLLAMLGSASWRATGLLRRARRWLSGTSAPPIAMGADVFRIRMSGLFDPAWYLAKYQDVAANGMDPAVHYLLYGGVEGRDPGPEFSSSKYLEANPDVASSGLNPLLHFIAHGIVEGRARELGQTCGRNA